MAQLSATDAAFAGFRVIRSKPLTIVVWSLLMIVATAASFALFIPTLQHVMAMAPELGDNPTPETLIPFLSGLVSALAPAFSAAMVIGLVYSSVIAAATNRAVLQPEKSAFGYLRLGTDELRQLVVHVAYSLLIMVTMFVVFLVIGMMTQMGSGVTRWLSLFAAVGLVIVASIYLSVRLSLAGAQTYARRRIDLFGSWALTKGRFWPILLAYFLAFILTCVVGFVGSIVAQLVLSMSGAGAAFDTAMFADPESLTLEELRQWFADLFTMEKLLSVGMIAYILINCVMQAITTLVIKSPPAAIYGQLTAPDEAAAI